MKNVWVCEGCGEIYNDDVKAEQCENSHSELTKKSVKILHVRFKPHTSEIQAICIEYTEHFPMDNKIEKKVWFQHE